MGPTDQQPTIFYLLEEVQKAMTFRLRMSEEILRDFDLLNKAKAR
jgi:hypothetical protein